MKDTEIKIRGKVCISRGRIDNIAFFAGSKAKPSRCGEHEYPQDGCGVRFEVKSIGKFMLSCISDANRIGLRTKKVRMVLEIEDDKTLSKLIEMSNKKKGGEW